MPSLPRPSIESSSAATVIAAWLAIAALTLIFAAPQIEDLGLYYDEAFLAQQARGFVEPERAGVHPASVREIEIAGRPFPIRNAAYLGSLKSQLLIPCLALFGSSPLTLRMTTLITGLVALLFCMLCAGEIFGRSAAIWMGLLVAIDPAFHFFSQFEWGPFTSLLLCRGLGLYGLIAGYRAERSGTRWFAFIAGGGVMGLGIYSRADFAVIVVSALLALILFRRDVATEAWRRGSRPLVAGAAVFVLALSPMLIVIAQLLGASAGMSNRGDIDYRLQVLLSTLDGSHFYRVISRGGLFDELFRETAPMTGFAVLIPIAAVALVMLAPRGEDRASQNHRLLLAMTFTIGGIMVMMPGAVRAHHMLNLMPLPHLIVALTGIGIWRWEWRDARVAGIARVCVMVGVAAMFYSSAAAIYETKQLVAETRGRGRWSHSLTEFAEEINARPNAEEIEVVSLDWGFHEPLLFLSSRVQLREPIWQFARGGVHSFDGNADTFYLVHAERYDLVRIGPRFEAALRFLDVSEYERRDYFDGTGEPTFSSIRFTGPHRIQYRGTFQIRMID